MCGIAGFLGDRRDTDDLRQAALAMAERLAHRGPDDAGAWTDQSAGIGLSHRRLSILDLSPAGHQPMVSPCERFVLTFNGEIYNHSALRAELERRGHHHWLGHSDTE